MRLSYVRTSLAVALLAAFAIPAQDVPAKKFAGTWEATFEGKVFSVLKIQAVDKVTGTMSAGDIDVDEDGNLRSAQAADKAAPILRANLENDSLTFEWNDDPQEQPLKFELKITGKQAAELRFVTAPNDAKIKPIKYTKRD